MATTFTGLRVQDTYNAILKIGDNTNLTGTAKLLSDGFGNSSAIYLSTTSIGIGVTPSYQLHTSSNAKIGGNLIVSGNLTVNGTLTYLNVIDLEVKDPLIKLASQNTANTLDIGFFGKYVATGTRYKGLFNDASDNKFKLFIGTTEEPDTTVNTSGNGYSIGTLVANLEGNVTGGTISGTTGTFSASVIANGNSNSFGNTTIGALSASSGTFSASVIASGNTNSFGATTFTGLVTGIAPTSDLNFATKKYVDDNIPTITTPALSAVLSAGNTSGENNLIIQDNDELIIGSSSDFKLYHNATNSLIRINTGNLVFNSFVTDGDITFNLDNGSGSPTQYLSLNGGTENIIFSKPISGTTGSFSGLVTGIAPTADLNFATKKYVDDSIPTIPGTPALSAVLAAGNTSGANDLKMADDQKIILGDDNDVDFYHTGGNGYLINKTGNLYIENLADDRDISFICEDGTGGSAVYLFMDGSVQRNKFFQNTQVNDNKIFGIGSDLDLNFKHDGTDSYINNNTGDLIINSNVTDGDITFNLDNGADPLVPTEYLRLDGGGKYIVASKNLGININPVSPLHLKYSGGNYGTDATSGFINEATTGRGTQRIRSITDSPAELFFDIDGGVSWDISARDSSVSNGLYFYNRAATPGYNVVGSPVVQFGQSGDITSAGNGIFSGRLELNDGVLMSGGWRRTAKLSSVYPVLVFQSTAGTQKFAGIGYDSSYGTRFWKNGTGVNMTLTASNWMSVPDSGTIEINQATRFSDFIRIDAGTSGNPVGGITWSSTDNGFLYAYAGGAIKAKIDSANDSYLLGGGLGIGTNSIEVAGTGFLGLHIKNTISVSGSSIVLENNGGHKSYIYTGTTTNELNIQAPGELKFNAGATNRGKFLSGSFGFVVGINNTTVATIRLGGDNAAGGRMYFEYSGDSSYIDCYGGHGGAERYRDLAINARTLTFKTGSTLSNTLELYSNGNVIVSNGALIVNSTNDVQLHLISSDTWCGISFDDGGSIDENIFYNGTHGTFAIGGGGSNVANKKLHIDGGVTIGSNYDTTAVNVNSLKVQGSITSAAGITTCGNLFSANKLGILDSTCVYERFYWKYDDNANQSYLWNLEADAFTSFYTNNLERVRIEASGSLKAISSNVAATTDYAVKVIKAVAPLVGGYTGAKIISLLGGYDNAIHGVDLGYAYNGTGYNMILSTNDNTSGDPISRLIIDNTGRILFGGITPHGKTTIEQGGSTNGLVINNNTTYPPTLYLRDAGSAGYSEILTNNNLNLAASNVGVNHTTPFNQISGTETTLAVSNSNVASLYLNNTASGGHNHIMFSGTGGSLSWYDKTAASYRMILFGDGTFGLNLTNITAGGFSPTFALKQKSNSEWGGINIESQADDSVLALGSAAGRHTINTSYRSSAGYKPLDIKAAGNLGVTIATNGHVGIYNASPSSRLHLKYSGGSYGTDATSGFINQADSGRSTTRLRSIGDNASELFFDVNGAIRWDLSARPSSQGYDLNFYPQAASPALNNVSAHTLALKQDGRVYFKYRAGFNTESPDAYVHVNLGAGGSNGTDGIRVNGLGNYPSLGLGISGNYHGMVRTYGNDLEMYAGHWRTIGNASSENHSIRFYTSKSGSNNWSTAKMTLNHDGMLEVNGATIMSGGWGEVIRAKATYPAYTFNSNNSKWGAVMYDYTFGMRIKVGATTSNVTASGIYAINITHSGLVKIGSSATPSYNLDVAGTMRATSDVIAFSDSRVKENIITINNALNKVTKLRGVTYTRKDIDDKSTKVGVIAQEVLDVLPEVVSKDNIGMYSVAYGNMAGLFIEAIKELKAEVNSLKQEIKQLKK